MKEDLIHILKCSLCVFIAYCILGSIAGLVALFYFYTYAACMIICAAVGTSILLVITGMVYDKLFVEKIGWWEQRKARKMLEKEEDAILHKALLQNDNQVVSAIGQVRYINFPPSFIQQYSSAPGANVMPPEDNGEQLDAPVTKEQK
jgi:hypothetical protein